MVEVNRLSRPATRALSELPFNTTPLWTYETRMARTASFMVRYLIVD
jgi:hypothetical protein